MLSRYSDMPAVGPGQLPAEERNLVLHAELPIISGHLLNGDGHAPVDGSGDPYRQ